MDERHVLAVLKWLLPILVAALAVIFWIAFSPEKKSGP